MTAQVPCAHCGLPAKASTGDEPAFCCIGCEAVYHALSEAGLEHFYELRGGEGQRPVDVASTPSELLRDQVRTLEDGTCELDLHLDGVHCAGCVWLVERMPRAVDGVVDARLNLSQAKLKVRWRDQDASLDQISSWLQRFGYIPHPIDASRAEGVTAAERKILVQVGIGWALAANIMLIAVAFYSGLDVRDPSLWTAGRWASMIMTALAIGFGGREFLARAWGSLVPWAGLSKLSVDVPISLGILGGFGFSAYATVTGEGEVWFDSIAVLIAALLTARWLQMRGRRFATHAAQRLLNLLPTSARRVADGQVEEVSANTLEPGDIVEVRLGDVFPGDGVIVSPSGTRVHRALLTGESRPEPVEAAGLVHAGETNVGSIVRVEIYASGAQTRVGRILAWVEDASANRAPIVQLADAIAGWFVLVVLMASAVTFAIWWGIDAEAAVQHTVALLVISCPCALGMATPLALTVGIGKAAREGIFIKHDDVLQALRDVDVVVFDKTGTVTTGETAVTDLGVVSQEQMRLIAALEAKSQHPFARAFDQWFGPAEVQDVVEHAGAGIEGTVDGHHVKVGRPDWLDIEIYGGVDTPIGIMIDGERLGLVRIGDPLRPESAEVICNLKARGMRTVLLSGDHASVVGAIRQELGIAEGDALASRTPEMKLAFVQELKAQGLVVAMVGDGVNDAAALQAADVGIAVQGGADLNLMAADIFLTRPGLELVARLFEGADVVMGVVRRNLAGSAIYNGVGITVAALGLVSPLFAAVAMPISSVSVVLSSLVQDPFRPRRTTNSGAAVHVPAAAE